MRRHQQKVELPSSRRELQEPGIFPRQPQHQFDKFKELHSCAKSPTMPEVKVYEVTKVRLGRLFRCRGGGWRGSSACPAEVIATTLEINNKQRARLQQRE